MHYSMVAISHEPFGKSFDGTPDHLEFLILGTLVYSYLDLDITFSIWSREIETVRTPLRGGLEHFGNCEASKGILDIIHVGCKGLV